MPGGRFSAGGSLTAVLFVLAPLVAAGWWLARPKGDAGAPTPAPAELDVVCSGRVDGQRPVAALDPTVPGKVAEVLVSEGQTVDAGAPLLRLTDEALKFRVEEAKAALAVADLEIEAAGAEAKLHPQRVAGQKLAIASAQDRTATARRLLDELRAAKPFGTITAAEMIRAEAEVRQLERLETVEADRLAELTALNPTLRVRAAEAKKAQARVALNQTEQAVRDCVLVAPSAGAVLRVNLSVGESVLPGGGAPALLFRPVGPLVVRAELEQEFIGRVRPGMRATVTDEAQADAPARNGRVVRVGAFVSRRRGVLFEPGEVNDVRTLECVVTLDEPTDGLLVGQRVRVRIGKD
ncbi:HlyD family efflux transporter periplasmic adaptor subunit [Gemmata sp. JC717]|uniref:HlyD family efflux transporter periplasmic adaptor subunit n=1 Tax=Gemmata algarum TaxID=2975278 RepID=A0ABU5F4K9_9BACT|nr:HlyD family efflux transporter periplasmic adaptor subunit [Gemmata algarum]MDY3551704.1 HlyD family efflux transporter periplasmic adaptor subunit [Gemmata algarum]MDY3561747.1 HlyD family efflux transporter periplasmic adaptor subunit [Gemmata algarum]